MDVGSISDSTKKLVENEEDLEALKKWLKIAARVNSIAEFVNNSKGYRWSENTPGVKTL